jgi:hypothetical protein
MNPDKSEVQKYLKEHSILELEETVKDLTIERAWQLLAVGYFFFISVFE